MSDELYALKARIAAFDAEMAVMEIDEIKGGKGSGNWGHKGRPGKMGGNAPRGGKGKYGGGAPKTTGSGSGFNTGKKQTRPRWIIKSREPRTGFTRRPNSKK